MIWIILGIIFGPIIFTYIVYIAIGLVVINDRELSKAWEDGRLNPQRILWRIFIATTSIVYGVALIVLIILNFIKEVSA